MSQEEQKMKIADEELRRKVTEIVIEDFRALGPIRMALLGIFPEHGRVNANTEEDPK